MLAKLSMNRTDDIHSLPNNEMGTVGGQFPKPIRPMARVRRRLPITHADYWTKRIRRRKYAVGKGDRVALCEAPEWSVRMKLEHRDVWFNLNTGNKDAAASLARDIYLFARTNGVNAAIEKFKPGKAVKKPDELTVGDWFEAIDGLKQLSPKTFRSYKAALRTIIAGILHVREDKSRFAYRGPNDGFAKWRERIDATKLNRLTPDAISRWQREFVARAGSDPSKIASRKRSANSYVRQARSLFTAELTSDCGLPAPSPAPFEGVRMFENGSTRYVSKINVRALIMSARLELKASDPESYKAWLLTFFGGLRKKEADLLEWNRIDWERGGARIEPTKWFSAKTESSYGLVALDPEVLLELRTLMPASEGDFVLAGKPPKIVLDRQYYRCEPTWQRLYAWLRSKGIDANKPVHELRKEAGATLTTSKGIYAASRFLRHSDLTTTSRHYADQKERLTTALGSLLQDQQAQLAVNE